MYVQRFSARVSGLHLIVIRNQQVTGSSPVAGSKFSSDILQNDDGARAVARSGSHGGHTRPSVAHVPIAQICHVLRVLLPQDGYHVAPAWRADLSLSGNTGFESSRRLRCEANDDEGSEDRDACTEQIGHSRPLALDDRQPQQ